MQPESHGTAPVPATGWEQRSTVDLVRDVASKASALVGKEIELARIELKNDFVSELAMVKRFAVAAVAALLALDMLLVAGVLALMPYADGRLVALAIAGALLLIAAVAGIDGWRRHVARPLERTRRTVEEDVRWAKEQLA